MESKVSKWVTIRVRQSVLRERRTVLGANETDATPDNNSLHIGVSSSSNVPQGRIELLIPSPGATAVRGSQCPSSVLADR